MQAKFSKNIRAEYRGREKIDLVRTSAGYAIFSQEQYEAGFNIEDRISIRRVNELGIERISDILDTLSPDASRNKVISELNSKLCEEKQKPNLGTNTERTNQSSASGIPG